VLGAYAALVFAVLIIGQGSVHMELATILVAPFVVLASKVIGLYDRDEDVVRKTTIEEAPSILHLAVLYALTAWLLRRFCSTARSRVPRSLPLRWPRSG
jgi:hypothetical protein